MSGESAATVERVKEARQTGTIHGSFLEHGVPAKYA